MKTGFKTTFFTNWHTMRWVAMSIGMFFTALAIIDKDIATGMLAAFFLFQGITNQGCMVSQSCNIPNNYSEQDIDQSKEPLFSKVK